MLAALWSSQISVITNLSVAIGGFEELTCNVHITASRMAYRMYLTTALPKTTILLYFQNVSASSDKTTCYLHLYESCSLSRPTPLFLPTKEEEKSCQC